jgi:ribosome-associated protein
VADLIVTAQLTVPEGELSWRFSRSSGPGGQGVNTTDSRVELSWDLERSAAVPDWLRDRLRDRLDGRLVNGVVTVVASEHRSQLRNREAARARLAALLREAAAPPAAKRRRRATPRSVVEARLDAKRRRSTRKRDRSWRYDERG